jgi:hypothetical protein
MLCLRYHCPLEIQRERYLRRRPAISQKLKGNLNYPESWPKSVSRRVRGWTEGCAGCGRRDAGNELNLKDRKMY